MPRANAKSDRRRRARDAAKPPAYRHRKGYDQAIVTFTDSRTTKRRDYWLGPYGSPESRELYYRLVAEWEALGKRLPPKVNGAKPDPRLVTINEIGLQYKRWANTYYSTSEVTTLGCALRVLLQLYGSTPAIEFGPKKLKLVRDEMVQGNLEVEHPRKPWSRKYTNGQIQRIGAIFKWAASHELLPASIYEQLKTLPSLKRGRCNAREGRKIKAVPIEHVEATRPFLSRQVNALVSLQLLTGARGGELLKLRPIDIVIDKKQEIWTFTPEEHKTAHHGHQRTIYFGERAQQVIEPFLADRPVDAFLFSPAEAEAERYKALHKIRKTPMSCGNVPGSNRVAQRERPPQDCYTSDSYRRAIERACDRAFPAPDDLRRKVKKNGELESKEELLARLPKEGRHNELRQWQRDHRWHPHQLRHTTATEIRREFGLEAARIILGHSSALVTDAVYAERDASKVIEVMRKDE